MTRKRKELFAHKIESITEITPGYFTVNFTRKFDFTPGQVVALTLNKENDPRLYSIASSNKASYMRILFDVKPDGKLTPPLSQVEKGDTVYVSKPFGKFIPSQDKEWWIATGTGIAPFISMMESGSELPQKLLHGSRTIDNFLFQDDISNQLKSDYLRFCTKEKGEGIIEGRLSNWLKSQESLPQNTKFYLCGNPEMVVDVRDIILSKGVAFENIMAEIYF
ncbi:FAD-binding oxidoreductase [Labilibacter marinus]|uniref:FAD-binding oxidoreductase n=1 Tax=Labilibacter marinus TaxID=1477105 RepID=UPI00094F9C6B|nr:FAD-binding oxidoreductase [Labilibacter marinus]